jgi:hypothetical protein
MSDKQYLTREWHIAHCNSGFDVMYIDHMLVAHSVPFASDYEGATQDFDLIRHIVLLHNQMIRSITAGDRT